MIRNVKYSRLPSNKPEPKGLPSQPAGLISLSLRHVVSVRKSCNTYPMCCTAPLTAVRAKRGCKLPDALQYWCLISASSPLCSLCWKNALLNITALLFRLFLFSIFIFFKQSIIMLLLLLASLNPQPNIFIADTLPPYNLWALPWIAAEVFRLSSPVILTCLVIMLDMGWITGSLHNTGRLRKGQGTVLYRSMWEVLKVQELQYEWWWTLSW